MMNEEKALVNAKYLLQKFPGKGGWTYATIPEIPPGKRIPFGWVRVNGSIDAHKLKRYKLMPMGNGQMFLPVKAEIRKIINKKAGDYVHIILYADDSLKEIPEEIIECFKNEPSSSYEIFISFTETEQKDYLNWIYDAKSDEAKIERIIKMMDRLKKKLTLYDINPQRQA